MAATALNVLRWLYGLFYTFVGLSWFGHRLLGRPWQTPEEPPPAQRLLDALTDSGFVDPMIATCCLAGGLLVLYRRTVPLGIAVLAPLVTGIALFHLSLTGKWVWACVHFGALALLAWQHRHAFAALCRKPPVRPG